MIIKRIQGRPARGEGDVGRERLIEAARLILRSQTTVEISRKAVADAAGVTPALVSYYFPDKRSLLEAATRPIIEKWLAELATLLGSDQSRSAKLKALIVLFIEFNKADSRILEQFIEQSHGGAIDGPHQHALLAPYNALIGFFQTGIEAGEWRSFDPTFVLLSLWGMCAAVARMSRLPPRPFGCDLPDAAPVPDQAESIMTLMVRGIASEAGRTGGP